MRRPLSDRPSGDGTPPGARGAGKGYHVHMLGRRPETRLEKSLGYRFKRHELLDLALTHRSHAYERGREEHYERLEFLGDAVLGLVAAEWLYRAYPDRPEGDLSKLKSQLVNRLTLAEHARWLGLGGELLLGVGEERTGGRDKSSLLADSLEALFGAVYLDGGLAPAKRVIWSMLEQAPAISSTQAAPGEGQPGLVELDAKTQLQELAQAHGWPLPEYRLTGTSGPDHSKVFAVECWLLERCAGRGEGGSKKRAEQRAAADALSRLPPG